MLLDCQSVLGDRKAAVCRELTKKFEEIRRGTLGELAVGMKEKPVKGEIVVVIDRVGQSTVNPSDLEADLRDALSRMTVRDASDVVAGAHGLPRRKVYQLALGLDRDNEQADDG
jgi:16S rRNA (cytidine1402-2'-O)-methyltransferase